MNFEPDLEPLIEGPLDAGFWPWITREHTVPDQQMPIRERVNGYGSYVILKLHCGKADPTNIIVGKVKRRNINPDFTIQILRGVSPEIKPRERRACRRTARHLIVPRILPTVNNG